MTTIEVQLGERSYPIHIAPGALAQLPALLAQARRAARLVIITDTVVSQHYGARVLASLQESGWQVSQIVVPEGERNKSLGRYNRIVAEMLRMKCGRDTAVLALGGGVIGDLAGFVAATYMRGLNFIQIPTTLLAQVDASIGGKVAVNHRYGKNLLGAFHQPQLVVIDTNTLVTLPQREVLCGLAEMIKHALICDRSYFAMFERELPELLNLHPEKMSAAIAQSCRIKAAIVSRDEKETGDRAWLNFGHTIGHALEAVCGFATLRHGEAVLVGMLAEAYLAKMTQRLAAAELTRITNFLRTLPLTLRFDGISMDEIEDFIARDKKAQAGAVRMVLLRAIGEAEVTADWPRAALREALDFAHAVFAAPPSPAR